VTATLDWAEQAARKFEVKPRRWPTPGAMARELDSSTRQTPALDLLDAELAQLADGDVDRLMFFMPPQEGKSQRVSRRFPLWLLAHDPTLRIGIVSYELDSAVRWGRDIKRDIDMNDTLGIILRADSKAAGRWETEQGGGVYCVGIGGALTGRPLDVLIIDDPVKDRGHAESKTYRDTAWDFWENVGKLRLSSRGKVVLIMTRWHHDDLAGRLETKESREWRVVSVPAIAEDSDPLGRAPGEELVSAQKRAPGYFRQLAASISNYVWLSLFQQRPTAAEGGTFPRGDWQYWTPGVGQRISLDGHVWDLQDSLRFITIDLATSLKTSADYTVAAAWAIPPNGDLVLLDRVRTRVEESGHFNLVTPLRQRWLNPYDITYVESRMFGTTLVYQAGKSGIPLAELHADADKFTRALPAANLAKQHRVWLPANAPWLDEWLDEHAEFPNGTHDDQVDVMAYAARVAIAHFLPMQTGAEEDAFKSDRSELNIMSIPF
jgi:predicted phage terminase large subunit-like protein